MECGSLKAEGRTKRWVRRVKIIATEAMLKRVEEAQDIKPARLVADKAYGTGPFLGWLSERKIIPHIPVLDRQHQTDGLLPREEAELFESQSQPMPSRNKRPKSSRQQ